VVAESRPAEGMNPLLVPTSAADFSRRANIRGVANLPRSLSSRAQSAAIWSSVRSATSTASETCSS
jgi:hypothetical protein